MVLLQAQIKISVYTTLITYIFFKKVLSYIHLKILLLLAHNHFELGILNTSRLVFVHNMIKDTIDLTDVAPIPWQHN